MAYSERARGLRRVQTDQCARGGVQPHHPPHCADGDHPRKQKSGFGGKVLGRNPARW